MKTYSLVHIGRDTFIMLNAKDKLTNKMCNSTIFVNKESANLDTNVFHYFGVKVRILIDKLDRRTKRFKELEKQYQYFTVGYLPEIKKRMLGNSLTPYKFK